MKIAYKYSGVAGIFVAAFTLSLCWLLLPGNHRQLTAISDMGVHSDTQALFSIGLLAGAVLSLVFFKGFIEKNYPRDSLFRVFYLTAVLCQILVALVPGNPAIRPSHLLHWAAALTLCFALICIMVRFAALNAGILPLDIRGRVVVAVSGAVFLANMTAVFFFESFALTQLMTLLVIWYWVTRVTFLPQRMAADSLGKNSLDAADAGAG